ncbi:Asp-tRNA(Asn)/Glu-tRNA(Gln) amidotransferase subunit GatC [Candidatus Micrarchaeota archaeon]|nr:Asp-tRNA(Asn)/Glu-tRNA(Gln) amidotransferase subunit GatC [Candidatus Micrarchaeota archaeon]
MEIEESTLKKIAEISRIRLTDEELKDLRKDLETILEHFSAIQNIDEKEELYYLTDKPIELREDVIEKCNDSESIFALFNKKHERYLVAPKSLE